MHTKTALVLTAFIVVVVAAAMAIRIEWAYAVTAIEYAPGQIAKRSEATGGETSANSQAPGQLAAQPGAAPASQYAPGERGEVKLPPS